MKVLGVMEIGGHASALSTSQAGVSPVDHIEALYIVDGGTRVVCSDRTDDVDFGYHVSTFQQQELILPYQDMCPPGIGYRPTNNFGLIIGYRVIEL